MKRKILVLLSVLLLALPAAVRAQFTFTTNTDGSLNIDLYTGSGGAVTIPDTTNGLPITSIGEGAFFHSTSVTGVTMGTNISIIGGLAFQECGALTSVTIGTGVTNIGTQAFFDCSGLTGITIPASVTIFGEYAFAACSRLTAILVAPSNPDFASVDGILFNVNLTTVVEYPGGLAGPYSIPGSVTTIGAGSFYSCVGLTSITISNNVNVIGDNAFTDCRGLTNVAIFNGVSAIGYETFADCSSLASITIPASITSISEAAFGGCSSLTNIAVNASNPDYSSVNGVLFNENQTTLLEYPGGLAGACTISNGVTSIATEAFVLCARLTSVTIPGSVASIGDYAFEECIGLTGAYFQGNAPTPGLEIFDDVNAAALVYYFAGTAGWGATYGGLGTVMLPQLNGVAVRDNQFGFTINGTNNEVVVVEACTNLANPNWQPLLTNTLTGTPFNFTDPQSGNFSSRFYRIQY